MLLAPGDWEHTGRYEARPRLAAADCSSDTLSLPPSFKLRAISLEPDRATRSGCLFVMILCVHQVPLMFVLALAAIGVPAYCIANFQVSMMGEVMHSPQLNPSYNRSPPLGNVMILPST